MMSENKRELSDDAAREIPQVLRSFIDSDGRLTQYPAKRAKQLAALEYLAAKFNIGCNYTQAEINTILERWHTFSDAATLRRDMYDIGLLDREPDGTCYWKPER